MTSISFRLDKAVVGTILVFLCSVSCLVTHIAYTVDMYNGRVNGGPWDADTPKKLKIIVILGMVAYVLAMLTAGCLLKTRLKLAVTFMAVSIFMLLIVMMDVLLYIIYFERGNIFFLAVSGLIVVLNLFNVSYQIWKYQCIITGTGSRGVIISAGYTPRSLHTHL